MCLHDWHMCLNARFHSSPSQTLLHKAWVMKHKLPASLWSSLHWSFALVSEVDPPPATTPSFTHILKGSCMLITTPMYKPASCSAKLLGHYFIQHQFVFVKHQTWEIVFVVCHLAYNNTEYSRLSCQITALCGLSLSAPLEGIRMKQELDRYSC